MNKGIERWVREDIRALSAYHVADASGMIKLDAMENPYHWPDSLKQEWLKELADSELNRYPDPEGRDVKNGLRACFNIDELQSIMLGNGSDELIQCIAMALAAPGRKVLAPEPSFVMYKMIATFVGMDYIGVPLDKNFQLDMPAMLAAIDQHQPAVIFLAQPNNPTGTRYPESDLRSILNKAEGLVVIDEAYIAFTDADALPLLEEFDNLVVMRTLSKAGLAGLRLGFLVGSPAWIEEFNKVRLPYNINILTQVSVSFALRNYEVLQRQTDAIKKDRNMLTQRLESIGLDAIWPSQANFILVRTPKDTAKTIFDDMKNHGVLVKCLHGAHPMLKDCLRLTIGTPKENEVMFLALQQALQAVLRR
ncbi:MAG: histidinol-phosphate transaminase [Gammaproteobacteria bacterium]|nr:MAG: histidinol-phosphate transaminase [Gammaproteobacteria bacterium]